MLPGNFFEKYRLPFIKKPWHRLFFIFFLFSLPFSIRKVLAIFSADGTFNEYTDISLYLSDIFLIAVLLIYILENRLSFLSIVYWKRMFHVEHLFLPIFIPFFFVFWSGLSIFWAQNLSLATFSFIKVIEGYFLYLYVLLSNVPRGTLERDQTTTGKCSTWNIWQTVFVITIISAFFQSIIAILQFIQQKSLGITILNESVFSINDHGIAKILINENLFIRSYGFFPHPNVLGGFLAISLLISTAYPLIFGYNLKLYNCSTWNIFKRIKRLFHVEHYINIWLYRSLIVTQLLALFFTFSKSAILGYIIGFIILIFGIRQMFHTNVPHNCSTWNIFKRIKRLFHVEHLVVIIGILLTGIIIFSFNLRFFLVQPAIERLFYTKSLQILFQSYFFQGLGIGQFVFVMQQFFHEKLEIWQFQPIHNVFLLIFSETGIVGISLFIWFFVYVFLKNNSNVPHNCSTWNIFKRIKRLFHVEHFQNITVNLLFRSILVVIAIIMLFDHYFWDIQQGQLLFWLVLSLAVSKHTIRKH